MLSSVCRTGDKLSSLFVVAPLNAFPTFPRILFSLLSLSLSLSVFPPEFNEIFSFSVRVNFHRVSPSGFKILGESIRKTFAILRPSLHEYKNFSYNLVVANRSITFARFDGEIRSKSRFVNLMAL